MSEMQQTGAGSVALSTERLMPSVQRFGGREIEITFLGPNQYGQPTWVMWNPTEPYLIGLLSQGRIGYHFEQRTDSGVLVHENISLQRVQRALGG
ncbi:MAG: hypothetical protein WDA07_02920 [Leucobacter sp.]